MLSIRIGLCFLKQLPYPYSRVWKKRECAWAVADLMRNAREAETKVYGWGLDVDVDEDGMGWNEFGTWPCPFCGQLPDGHLPGGGAGFRDSRWVRNWLYRCA